MNAIKTTAEKFIKAAEHAGWEFVRKDDDLLMFRRNDALYGCAAMSAQIIDEDTIWGDESVAEYLA